ncbi:MAG: hypothetical protein JWQ12_1762 [Glaciihabitans sp.]|nr:hypothetical protein [Glaciihabitans sp.]
MHYSDRGKSIIQLSNELKAALEHVNEQGIVLVIGAGSSLDDPTGFELGSHYSELAHLALTRRGVIAQQPNPWDLSELADAVVTATGAQDLLVAELPIPRMKLASANLGHEIAAALQADGFVRSILTLNYDTAMAAAIAHLGESDVHVIERIEDLPSKSSKTLIYLHGSANGLPRDLVLTTADLDSTWQGSWKELIANQTLLAPVIAFVGLGSSANLVSSTLQKIVEGVGGATSFVLVGPGDQSVTTFASSIGANAGHCIDCGWEEFMKACAAYALATLVQLSAAKFDVIERQRSVVSVDTAHVLEEITQLGYLEYGAARAKWFGVDSRRNYMPHPAKDTSDLVHLADVIHLIAEIESWMSTSIRIVDGDVNVAGATVSIYSSQEPADFETAVTRVQARIDRVRPSRKPSAVIIARTNPPERIAAPASIVFGGNDDQSSGLVEEFDIIRSQAEVGMFYLPDVRSDPTALIGAIS